MLKQQDIHSKKAASYTAIILVICIILLLVLKWKLPKFEKDISDSGVDVEVNWPPDPPQPFQDGGGGGGQALSAPDQAGITPSAPLEPGEQLQSKAVETDQLSSQSAIPNSVVENKKPKILASNNLKAKPKKNIEPTTPPKPKAVMGKTNRGNASGGDGSGEFEKTGGAGNGLGAGIGNGTAGGSGAGTGGGNGTGIGIGNGPRVTRGDRRIIRSYAFEGELNKATLYVNISVSPEGVGKFVNFAKGSTATGSAYRQAIVQYLEKIRFDATDHESMVTVQFNFRIN